MYAPETMVHEGKSYAFDDLSALDPALKALELLARRAAPAANGDEDYRVFSTEVKPLVTALVGWERGTHRDVELPSFIVLGDPGPSPSEIDAILSTSDAYDVVYHHLIAVIGGEA